MSELEEFVRNNYKKISAPKIAEIFKTTAPKIYKIAKKLNITSNLNPVIEIDKEQEQILLGGILGDGNFKKNGTNYYYREVHAIGEEEYLKWKFEKLKNMTTGKIYDIKARNGYSPQVGFQTRNSPIFTKYALMKIEDVISNIDELGFAVWMLDDGWFRKKGRKNSFAISAGNLNLEQLSKVIDKAEELGFTSHCVKPNNDLALGVKNNSRIKEIMYNFFPKDLDIIKKKINGLIE